MKSKCLRTLTAMIFLVAGTLVPVSVAHADTGAPPNGQNLGFRIIWSPAGAGTLNTHAGFLKSDGSGLSLCGVPAPNTTSSGDNCSYDFEYSINGTVDKKISKSTSYVYKTWPAITDSNKDDVLCRDAPGANTPQTDGPHTNYNCFNQNTYGQIFKPNTSGSLSGFTMAMTCLSPTGSTSLTANLYETSTPVPFDSNTPDAPQSTISGTPLASATFSLSNCSTSWSAKTFADSDFTYPTMNFGSVNLDSTKWYAVLFTGEAVAGTPPSGSVNNTTSNVQAAGGGTSAPAIAPAAAEQAPQLAKTGAADSPMLAFALILMFFGYTAYSIGFEEMRKAKVLKWLGLDWLDFKIK